MEIDKAETCGEKKILAETVGVGGKTCSEFKDVPLLIEDYGQVVDDVSDSS